MTLFPPDWTPSEGTGSAEQNITSHWRPGAIYAQALGQRGGEVEVSIYLSAHQKKKMEEKEAAASD